MEFNISKASWIILILGIFYTIAIYINIKVALIFILLISFYLFIYDFKLLIILYIALLPTNGLIKNEFYLFNIINIDIVINLLIFVVLINRYKYVKSDLYKLQKYSITITLIFLLYTIFTSFKDAYFGLFEMDYTHALIRSINYIFKFLPLVLLIKRLHSYAEIRGLIFTGIFIGIIILCLSTFNSDSLAANGFKTSNIEIEQTINSSVSRNSGVFANGDKNSLGVFLVMFIGFYFSLIEKIKISKYYTISIIIAIVGVLVTVSRTAVVSLLFVLFLYSIRNSISTFFKIIVLGCLLLIIFPNKITPIVERFQYSQNELDYNNPSSRIGKWINYVKHFSNSPAILVRGNSSNFYLSKWAASKKYINATHNLYLEMIYRGGLIFPLFILVLYYKIAKWVLKNKFTFNYYYYIIPFLFVTFYTPDWGSFYYLGFYLSMNSDEFLS